MATRVQQRGAPDGMRQLSGLDSVDYSDTFTAAASGADALSAERWARRILGSSAGRRFGPFVWRRICGLRLEPREAPGTVEGWRIAGRGAGWIRLEAASWFMRAHALVQTSEDEVSIGLFVKYTNPLGAVVWPPIAFLHQRAVPGMLAEAAGQQGIDVKPPVVEL